MNSARKSIIAVVAFALGFGMPVLAVPADNNSLRDLTAEWWQWVFSIPPSENPLLDATGAKCVVGQRGSTWFLAGTAGGGPVVRGCSVPEGAPLFFPIANASFFDSPNVCGQGPERIPVGQMRAANADFIDGVTGISVELDGQPVEGVRRIQSRVFAVALPEDNLLDAPCAPLGGLPAGIYFPAVDDGYYVSLKPLAAGEHTLHFHAENPNFGFVIDTTYHLTVVPLAGN